MNYDPIISAYLSGRYDQKNDVWSAFWTTLVAIILFFVTIPVLIGLGIRRWYNPDAQKQRQAECDRWTVYKAYGGHPPEDGEDYYRRLVLRRLYGEYSKNYSHSQPTDFYHKLWVELDKLSGND